MTPRDFLRKYYREPHLRNGHVLPSGRIGTQPGERVGVVLINQGGPYKEEDVAPFFYNVLMDPAFQGRPMRGILRHWYSRLRARLRAKSVRADYEAIGGGAPTNRLTREQAQALEQVLNRTLGAQADVVFKTYVLMRYWHPSAQIVAEEMEADGIDKVILLPLYPQYSRATTGSALAYWRALQDTHTVPAWETTFVPDLASHPQYIQAQSERIDEALQRFSRTIRSKVQLILCVRGVRRPKQGDPYLPQVDQTVENLLHYRNQDLNAHLSFLDKSVMGAYRSPSTVEVVEKLAKEGHEYLLVVPLAFVSDHIETAYALDVKLREVALKQQVKQYELCTSLNCHPLFIESLADLVSQRLEVPGTTMGTPDGDGVAQVQPPSLTPTTRRS